MMHHALLARITDTVLLADESSTGIIEGCLEGLASHERFQDMMALSGAADLAMADDFWDDEDWMMSKLRPYNVVDGILQVPVQGMLLSRFPFQVGGWATGYTYIQRAVQRGDADDAVKGIALIINSPGGEVAQCFDMMDALVARKGTKPLYAFAADSAYSAAYITSLPADKIIVTRTGGVGSIGVVTSHVDYSERMKKEGVKVTFISAPKGGFKTEGNPYEPLSKEAQARIQKRIDSMYDMFVDAVVSNRPMGDEAVRGTKALCFSAKDAVNLGLADSVGSLEDSLADFTANSTATGVDKMAITQEDLDKAVAAASAKAKAEGVTEGRAAALTEGASAAKDRITAILGCDEAKDRPKAAMAFAMKSDVSLEVAKVLLGDMPVEAAANAAADAAAQAAQAAATKAAEEKAAADKEAADKAKANKQNFSAAMEQTPQVSAGSEEGEDEKPLEGLALAHAYGLAGYGAKEKAK